MYSDDKFREAVVKAIKSYFKGKEVSEYQKVSGDIKYNKKYFDKFEEERFGSKHNYLD